MESGNSCLGGNTVKNIAVIGVGYVGLVTGTCFADLGNLVIGLDISEEKVTLLKKGIMPIFEPGLKEMVDRNVAVGRLSFTTSYAEALEDVEFAFIAVGTPSGVEGEADLQYVRAAAIEVARNMKKPLIIINKSTVPVGTGDWVADIVREHQPEPIPFSVVSCPEFLREGSAISDFMSPARAILGSTDEKAAERVADLHLPLRAPIMITNLRTAEMIKYASNAFLATKISFINEIANICESLGADVKEVAAGMGYDPRIGKYFLGAGLGYGGSCFPKDVLALYYMANQNGSKSKLLKAVMEVNSSRRDLLIKKAQQALGALEGKTIGLLGLTFKPNTDDLRDAPALEVARNLLDSGAHVRGYDPVGMPGTKTLIPEIEMTENAYDLSAGCDALIVCTEWNEFINLDLKQLLEKMKQPVVIDGRNIYDPEVMMALGFRYYGIGRGYLKGGRPLIAGVQDQE